MARIAKAAAEEFEQSLLHPGPPEYFELWCSAEYLQQQRRCERGIRLKKKKRTKKKMKNRTIKRAVRSRRTFAEGRRDPATARLRKEGIAQNSVPASGTLFFSVFIYHDKKQAGIRV